MAGGKLVWVSVACGAIAWASCSSDAGDGGPAGTSGAGGGAGQPAQGDAGAESSVAGTSSIAGGGGGTTNGGVSGDAGEANTMAGNGAAPSGGGNGGAGGEGGDRNGGGNGGAAGTPNDAGAAGTAGTGDGGSGGQPASTQLGDISGTCGAIDAAMIASASPSTVQNSIDLGTVGFTVDALSVDGRAIYDAAPGGGSSAPPEALSFEVLATCDGADLVKTEDKIVYDTAGAKTDYSIEIDGLTVGVAVTRAFAFPDDTGYTVQVATTRLEERLENILLSSSYVSEDDAWQKQILHVIARSPQTAATTIAAYTALDAETKADTILVVTITDGVDQAIY